MERRPPLWHVLGVSAFVLLAPALGADPAEKPSGDPPSGLGLVRRSAEKSSAEQTAEKPSGASEGVITAEFLVPPAPSPADRKPDFLRVSATKIDSTLAPDTIDPLIDPIAGEPADGVVFPATVGPHLGLRHDTGPGLGYRQSFTTFETTIPLLEDAGLRLTFLDARLLLSNTGTLGANVGLAHRRYVAATDHVYGVNAFYDNRDTHSATFSQLGTGFEILDDDWEFRTNVYLPVGSTSKPTSPFGDPFFRDTNIFLRRDFESAMTGFDMEGGVPLLPESMFDLWGYLGGYHYQPSSSNQAYGVSGRIALQATNNLSIELALRNDRVFDTTVVCTVAWRLWGRRGQTSEFESVLERMRRPIVRNENIVVAAYVQEALALDVTSGTALNVLHVDNAGASGNGSFESPFATLAEAESASGPGDILFVRRGDGTTTGLDQGIRLQQGQRLLGEGTPHPFSTTLGDFEIAATGTGPAPRLTAPGDVVTLADQAEVAGFAIVDAGGRGIFGDGIDQATIRDNRITDPGTDGIFLTEPTGRTIIARNEVFRAGAGGIAGRGIALTTSGLIGAGIDDNRIVDSRDEGFFLETTGSADAIFIFKGIEISGSDAGGSGAAGFHAVTRGDSLHTLTILEGGFDGNHADGFLVESFDTGKLGFGIGDATFNDNAGAGVRVRLNDASDTLIGINQSFAGRNAEGGIVFEMNDVSASGLSVTSSQIADNLGFGVRSTYRDQASGNNTLSFNLIENNGALGAGVDTHDDASIFLDVNSSIVRGNGVGVGITANDASTVVLSSDQNGIDENDLDGFLLRSAGSSTFTALVGNNEFQGNNVTGGTAGFFAEATDNSTFRTLFGLNDSDSGFQLTNGPTSLFEVEDALNLNTGSPVNQTGIISIVPQGDIVP